VNSGILFSSTTTSESFGCSYSFVCVWFLDFTTQGPKRKKGGALTRGKVGFSVFFVSLVVAIAHSAVIKKQQNCNRPFRNGGMRVRKKYEPRVWFAPNID